MRTNHIAREHFLPFSVYRTHFICTPNAFAALIYVFILNMCMCTIRSLVCGSVLFFVFPVQQAFVLCLFFFYRTSQTAYNVHSDFFLLLFVFGIAMHITDAIFKCILLSACVCVSISLPCLYWVLFKFEIH